MKINYSKKTASENIPKRTKFDKPEEHQIGPLSRIAAKWVVSLNIVKNVIAIGATIVISRYIKPAEFGVATMALGVMSFLVLFDTGMTWSIVQAEKLDEEKSDSLFSFCVFLGIFMWMALAITGGYIADFYSQPELKLISVVIGAAIFFNSMCTQPAALLKRNLSQKKNDSIDTSAVLVSSIFGVILSVKGFGYWSIVWQAVSMQATRAILLLLNSEHKPSFPKNPKSAIHEIKRGAVFAASNYVCYVQFYLPGIIVGRYFGEINLGNYQRANGVKSMPTTYATMVATDLMVSSLSALSGSRERMGDAYRKALRVTATIGCPAGLMLFTIAPEFIHLLYGRQWSDAASLLKWFSIAAAVLPISTTTIWLFLATGEGRLQFKMNGLISIFSIFGFILALQYGNGLEAIVATETSLYALIILPFSIIVSHRAAKIKVRATIKALLPILISSVAAVFSSEIVSSLFAQLDWRWLFLLKISTGLVAYLSVLVFLFRELTVVYILKSKIFK